MAKHPHSGYIDRNDPASDSFFATTKGISALRTPKTLADEPIADELGAQHADRPTSARSQAITALQTALANEATARATGDTQTLAAAQAHVTAALQALTSTAPVHAAATTPRTGMTARFAA